MVDVNQDHKKTFKYLINCSCLFGDVVETLTHFYVKIPDIQLIDNFFFRCSACDSIFPSLMSLEHHKEEFEHWSDEDDDILTESEDDEDDTIISEECERLL